MPIPKKSKRTNWKRYASHCEQVIDVLNSVERARSEHSNDLLRKLKEWQERAEAAEKHNALLLEEREKRDRQYESEKNAALQVSRSGAVKFHWDTEAAAKRWPPPTHWQRFKSWLSRRGK